MQRTLRELEQSKQKQLEFLEQVDLIEKEYYEGQQLVEKATLKDIELTNENNRVKAQLRDAKEEIKGLQMKLKEFEKDQSKARMNKEDLNKFRKLYESEKAANAKLINYSEVPFVSTRNLRSSKTSGAFKRKRANTMTTFAKHTEAAAIEKEKEIKKRFSSSLKEIREGNIKWDPTYEKKLLSMNLQMKQLKANYTIKEEFYENLKSEITSLRAINNDLELEVDYLKTEQKLDTFCFKNSIQNSDEDLQNPKEKELESADKRTHSPSPEALSRLTTPILVYSSSSSPSGTVTSFGKLNDEKKQGESELNLAKHMESTPNFKGADDNPSNKGSQNFEESTNKNKWMESEPVINVIRRNNKGHHHHSLSFFQKNGEIDEVEESMGLNLRMEMDESMMNKNCNGRVETLQSKSNISYDEYLHNLTQENYNVTREEMQEAKLKMNKFKPVEEEAPSFSEENYRPKTAVFLNMSSHGDFQEERNVDGTPKNSHYGENSSRNRVNTLPSSTEKSHRKNVMTFGKEKFSQAKSPEAEAPEPNGQEELPVPTEGNEPVPSFLGSFGNRESKIAVGSVFGITNSSINELKNYLDSNRSQHAQKSQNNIASCHNLLTPRSFPVPEEQTSKMRVKPEINSLKIPEKPRKMHEVRPISTTSIHRTRNSPRKLEGNQNKKNISEVFKEIREKLSSSPSHTYNELPRNFQKRKSPQTRPARSMFLDIEENPDEEAEKSQPSHQLVSFLQNHVPGWSKSMANIQKSNFQP